MTLKRYQLKRALLAPLLIALLLTTAACDNFRKDDRQRVISARQYLEQQDIRAAAIELQNALQLNPQNAEARYLLAKINLDVGSANIAEKEFRHAVELDPTVEDASIGLALALLEQHHYQKLLDEVAVPDGGSSNGRASLLGIRAAAEAGLGKYSQAAKTLQTASALQPDNLHVLISEARIAIAENRIDAAKVALDKVRTQYPRNLDALFLLAGIAHQRDQRDEIKELLLKVVELDLPKIVTIYEWRARLGVAQLLMEEGQLEQAQEYLDPLMSRIQQDADSMYLAALLSFKLGEYELAGQRLQQVLELKADHRPALLLLGSVNYLLAEYEQAAYYLSKYVATVPEDLSARKLLGQTYFELDAHKELREVLKPILDDRHSDAEVVAMVGLSALRTGQLETGVAEIEKAVAMSPDNARLREYLARAYIISGEPDRAIEELENVLGAEHGDRRAEILLILAHLKAGNNADANAVAIGMVRDDPNDPRILTIAGNVFLVSGDREKALRFFNSALQLRADYLPARMALARVYENQGEFTAARELYEKLIATSAQKLLPMLALANLEENQGNMDRMQFWLNEALALTPPRVAPRILLANFYLTQGKTEVAAKLIEEALAIEPRNLTVRLLEVRALMAKGHYTKALPILTELAASRPASVSVSLLLAESSLRLGKTDEALRFAGAVLNSQPDSIPANMLMAAASIDAEQYEQALVYAGKLKELKPDWHKGYEIDGDVYMAMADYENAELAYGKAAEYAQVRELALKLSQVYMHSGRLDAAAGELETWNSVHGEDERTLLSLGIVYQLQNRLDEAVGAYEGVLAVNAGNHVALNNLAGILDKLGDPRALEFAERAYRSHRDAPNIQDTYGWLLTKNGNAAEGKRLLEKALEKLPGNPDIRYHLYVALYDSGERSRAKSLLKRLLEEDIAFEEREKAIEYYEKIK